MDQTTVDHLDTARRYEALAYQLISPNSSLQPPPLEWAVVVAFYAAVHYVNAYLWEKHQFAPTNHRERTRRVWSEPELKPIYANYALLRDWAWQARYTVGFRLTTTQAQKALDVDLKIVAQTVTSFL